MDVAGARPPPDYADALRQHEERIAAILETHKQEVVEDLKIMVHGMLNCGKPLLWSSLLLALLAYMYNVFMLQISSEWLRTLPDRSHPDDADYPQETVDYIHENFGSLLWGMYTLLKCITGGVSWQDIADPLTEISPLLIVAFLLYVLLGVACLLNLITAVFLDAAYHTSQGSEADIMEHIEQKRAWITEAKAFFAQEFESHGCSSEALSEHEQEVTVEDFAKVVQAPRVRMWFEKHELDMYFADARSIFDLIDVDADQRLDMHEFVVGLYRLKGGASSLTLQLELKNALLEVGKVKRRLHKYHSDIVQVMSQAGFGVGYGSEAAACVPSQGTRAFCSVDVSTFRRAHPEHHVAANARTNPSMSVGVLSSFGYPPELKPSAHAT